MTLLFITILFAVIWMLFLFKANRYVFLVSLLAYVAIGYKMNMIGCAACISLAAGLLVAFLLWSVTKIRHNLLTKYVFKWFKSITC